MKIKLRAFIRLIFTAKIDIPRCYIKHEERNKLSHPGFKKNFGIISLAKKRSNYKKKVTAE